MTRGAFVFVLASASNVFAPPGHVDIDASSGERQRSELAQLLNGRIGFQRVFNVGHGNQNSEQIALNVYDRVDGLAKLIILPNIRHEPCR